MEEKRIKRRNIILIAVLLAALLAAGIAGAFLIRGRMKTEAYRTYTDRGQRYMEEMDYENAIAQFELAVEQNPDAENGYVNLYEALYAAGYLNQAESVLRQGLEITGSARLELLLARYLEEGQPEGIRDLKGEETEETGENGEQGEAVLNTAFLQRLGSYLFEDYEREYGAGSASKEGSGYVVIHSGIDAEFYYDGQKMEAGREVPRDTARADYVRLKDLGMLFRNFSGSISLEEISALIGRQPSVNYSREQNSYVMEFTYRQVRAEIACDEAGQITGEDVWNRLTLPEASESEEESLEGTVIDAVTGEGIADAEITLISGDTGEEYTTVTDEDGVYSVEAPAGVYSMQVEKEGYVQDEQEIAIGEEEGSQEIILSPELAAGEIRAVLSWGSTPKDLDLHLSSEAYPDDPVFFGDKVLEGNNGTVAELDVDETSGYGPETITIYESGGSYVVGVHNFSGTGRIGETGASVRIYLPGQSPVTITAPDADGNFWTVCTIENGQIQIINEITEEAPSGWT